MTQNINKAKLNTLLIQSTNSAINPIKIELVNDASIIPSTFEELDHSFEITDSFASQIGESLINLGFTSLATDGLYKITGGVENLLVYNDNTISSITINDQKIINGHNGFSPADQVNLLPQITFEVLSFITGQYYLHNINNQLDKLNLKVNNLYNLKLIEKESEIRYILDKIKDYEKRKDFFFEDFSKMDDILERIFRLREEYYKLLLNSIPNHRILFENDKTQLIQVSPIPRPFKTVSSTLNSMLGVVKDVYKVITKIKKENSIQILSDFKYLFGLSKIVIMLDNLYHVAKKIQMKMNFSDLQNNPNRKKIIIGLIDELSNKESFFKKTKNISALANSIYSEFLKIQNINEDLFISPTIPKHPQSISIQDKFDKEIDINYFKNNLRMELNNLDNYMLLNSFKIQDERDNSNTFELYVDLREMPNKYYKVKKKPIKNF